MKASMIGAALALWAGVAWASEECAAITDDASRLACYDGEYRPASVQEESGSWSVRTRVSPIDDSVSVFVTTESLEPIPSRFRGEDHAQLMLRCQENTTSLIVHFAGNHMSAHQQYGEVTLRIDSDEARKVRMESSTDNRALGLWQGSRSIPEIRRMFDAEVLTLRATPFSASPVTAQFPIAGAEQAVEKLRKHCNW